MNKNISKYKLLYSFAKLIRIENLFLMALVLYVANDYIYRKEMVALSPINLWILILSTISIGAGGYVINDYFDLKIDKVNKPNEVVLEKTIHRKAAILWHLFFSIIGMTGGIYLAYLSGHLSLSSIQLASIVLLLIYSNILKKIFILGNITISLLAGLLPILPYIYINAQHPHLSIITANALLSLCAFAFFTTLIRELIKDIQDIEGDSIGGRKTIPIVWGFLASKIIIFFLLFLLIIFLLPFVVYYYWQRDYLSFWYHILLLILPTLIMMLLTIFYQHPKQFSTLSLLMKLVMLLGVIYYYIF